MSWTFGDLRDFFHGGDSPSTDRFDVLFGHMMRAHAEAADEVEQEWLPYALENLEAWPDEARRWEDGVWYGDDGEDTFVERTHPLHALGRALDVEDLDAHGIVAYCHAPDIAHLTSLDFFGGYGVDAEALEAALTGLQDARLTHLGLANIGFDDACAAVLREATSLSGLVSLDVSGGALSPSASKSLVQAPQFAGLRDLTFGDVRGTHTPDVGIQLQLMARLPELTTTLRPHNAVPPRERRASWEGLEPGYARLSVRERVERALSIYRLADAHEEYPFLGEGFQCYGAYSEVSAEDFGRDDLGLDDVFAGAAELARDTHYGITSVHAATLMEGSLDEVFGAGGELIAPLSLRAVGKMWMDPPPGRLAGAYAGACYMQTQFAKHGLCLDEGEDGVLRLTPGGCERASALVRYWRAHHVAQEWVGGRLLDYCCSPWCEPLGGEVEDVNVRASIVWKESIHAFDRGGELPGSQLVLVAGDGVAWTRALRAEGFEVEVSSRSRVLILTDPWGGRSGAGERGEDRG